MTLEETQQLINHTIRDGPKLDGAYLLDQSYLESIVEAAWAAGRRYQAGAPYGRAGTWIYADYTTDPKESEASNA